ncbi:MAG: Succinate dehydrogenase/Fumarate reductase transmembrane subunit [Syntrophaceae bacterium PtaU1.Bin231]|nr:MAG: Succinate dehydrogenase/Fumarate reductase transmembrane subunit [Syntrophaceae bacterium PtaU1.Bin231]
MKETAYWTWFIIAGVVIFVFAGIHVATVHLSAVTGFFNPAGPNSVAWENVAYRSRNLFFVISYILILGAALYHGFYGLRTIVFELGLKQPARRSLTAILWVVGLVLFIFGTYAAISSRNPAMTL